MIFILTSFMFFATAAAPTAEQESLLKSVDQKYQAASSVVMDTKKTTKGGVFDQLEESEGVLYVKKGKLRLEVQNKDKEKSLVVGDGNYLWLVTPPPAEFKNAKTQVVKASMTTKQARSQGLFRILTEGGILKYFKITGVKNEGVQVVYSLKPQKESQELTKAQLTLDSKEKQIAALRYWDSVENETDYRFSNVKFNEKLNSGLFQYVPPKNANVVSP